MRSFKLGAIGIVAIMILLVIPGSTAAKDKKTGECWIINGGPSIEGFIGNFEIEQGKTAYDDHWVLETRDYHDAYYAYAYYTHYYTKITTEYGMRMQIKRYVPEDYEFDPAFNFGWAGYEYNDPVTVTYAYNYDNGAAQDPDDVMDDFAYEASDDASVKITTGSGAGTHSLTLGTSGDLNNVRVYIPNTVDETIEDPESGETYEIDLPGQQTIDVIISESGDTATVETPLEADTWVIAS